jgi:hypothetical protein
VQQEVEAPPPLADRLHRPFDLRVVADVQVQERRVARLGDRAGDAVAHQLALVGERQLHPRAVQRLRARPGDGVLVRDADDQPLLTCE